MTIPLFLSSLRFLDLDKHQDWPNITPQIFSTKDAQQNQKNRIRCVEWALFRLFELYDVEETRNKLQPFFPPLEPVQSLNLRAALFRCLSELKKNGVLGRDIVLRKTMLDECKGERFEEVLSVFAAVVLKKRLASNERSFVTQLATATSLTAEEQNILQPLTITHRASLANRLRTREELRGRYEDFGGLVELKRRQLVRREEELILANGDYKKEPVIEEDEAHALREKWRENWPGDEKSLNAIINGDVRHGNDALLNGRYGRIWEKVENGRLGEIEAATDRTLLQELDGRVRDHRRRLERWKEFRRSFDKRAVEQKPKSTTERDAGQQAPFGLSFDAHKGLLPEMKSPLKHMPAMKSQGEASQTDEAEPAREYRRLLQSMEAELAKVGKSRRNGGTGWMRTKKEDVGGYALGVGEYEDMSRASLEAPKAALRAVQKHTAKDVVVKEMPEPIEQLGDISDMEPTQQESDDRNGREMYENELGATSPATSSDESDEMPAPKIEPPTSRETPAKKSESPRRNTRMSLAGPSEQEFLAEQIVSSVTNSEPSPVKPPLTLVERTRMSMAPRNNRLSILPWAEDDDNVPKKPEPAPTNPAIDLMERTRKSMSVFQLQQAQAATAQQRNSRPRKSTAPQSRKSAVYPPIPSPLPETPNEYQTFGSTSSTPREELFSQEADYASVFKSRPKIALSPTFSPAVGEDADGDADADAEEDVELPGLDESLLSVRDEWLDHSRDGAAERWESPSPLVRARDRGRGGW